MDVIQLENRDLYCLHVVKYVLYHKHMNLNKIHENNTKNAYGATRKLQCSSRGLNQQIINLKKL